MAKLRFFRSRDVPIEPGVVRLVHDGDRERWGEHGYEKRKLVHADARQSLDLVWFEFAPGAVVPRHRHDTDEIVYVLSGEVRVGRQRYGAGDGFSMPRHTAYAYVVGPDGVTLLEVRDAHDYTTETVDEHGDWPTA
ncbi:MAG: hypothetical protein JWO68_3289 [Actinomycetia bacterium]|nr:hypothetical protein [Actinomycetes bacterium]